MDLVIVESPTKAKTIQKFLGSGFEVLSSMGHIRDLPKSKLGIDVEKNFEPDYIVPIKAKKNLTSLKKAAAKSDKIILATDEDREGESIAWHLSQILELKEYERIVFHEITQTAIQNALKNPRTIDINLVDAQQARRVLDRLVGYKLSPFLWKKVARGLSAGRVQSVAVRLVVERENEIKAFAPQEYWSIEAVFKKDSGQNFSAVLSKIEGKAMDKFQLKNRLQAEETKSKLEKLSYSIDKISRRETKRNPSPPFTTSSLQQSSWQRFKLPAKSTMRAAQALYERGFITYHRTDSLNLSAQSLETAKEFIVKNFGKEYFSSRVFKAKGRAQEAHEAIRPTSPENLPEKIKAELDHTQAKVYELIWQRFLASQMSQAIFDQVAAEIGGREDKTAEPNFTFQANGQVLKFDGFLKVYRYKFEENELPTLEEKERVEAEKFENLQHFTQPPPRYNEATLIKTLEEFGIGRPSTYAPILSTIQERNYIEKDDGKRFKPTEIGEAVNNLLTEHFPQVVDYNFTAKLEEELDEVAEGEKKWVPVIREFYDPFAQNLEKKYEEVSKEKIAVEQTDRKCPKCGSPLIIRLGRFGKFYACSNFPKCRFTESLESKALDIKCPKCQTGDIVEKRTKRRKIFYGCSRFPECDFALWYKPTGEKCPVCGSLMAESARGKKIKCSNKDCKTNEKVAK